MQHRESDILQPCNTEKVIACVRIRLWSYPAQYKSSLNLGWLFLSRGNLFRWLMSSKWYDPVHIKNYYRLSICMQMLDEAHLINCDIFAIMVQGMTWWGQELATNTYRQYYTPKNEVNDYYSYGSETAWKSYFEKTGASKINLFFQKSHKDCNTIIVF